MGRNSQLNLRFMFSKLLTKPFSQISMAAYSSPLATRRYQSTAVEKPTCGNILHTAHWGSRMEAERFNLKAKIKYSWRDDLTSTAVRARSGDSRRFTGKLVWSQIWTKSMKKGEKKRNKRIWYSFIFYYMQTAQFHTHMQANVHTWPVQMMASQSTEGKIMAAKMSKCSCSAGRRVKLLKTLLRWWSLWAELHWSRHNLGLQSVRACVCQLAHA